ncbi:MAG: nuclear transport factor 2 family protein [Candidatus Aenigmarchaeota archaeon]|nr:nuclear transport factor 2 family protein [Candidatus Aenigmarchaeota archaeon]
MDVKALSDELDRMIGEGKILEAFDRFYADEVVMQDNETPPRMGKAASRAYEEQFVAAVKEFHGAELRATAATGDVSVAEWFFDFTLQDGTRVRRTQVAIRRWKDGKVVHEKFYYGS